METAIHVGTQPCTNSAHHLAARASHTRSLPPPAPLPPSSPLRQALANTLWSFANLRWYPVQLLEPITAAVGRKLHTMSPQEISNSIWAYAK